MRAGVLWTGSVHYSISGRSNGRALRQDGYLKHRTLASCFEDFWNPYIKYIIVLQLRWGHTLGFKKRKKEDTDESGEKEEVG